MANEMTIIFSPGNPADNVATSVTFMTNMAVAKNSAATARQKKGSRISLSDDAISTKILVNVQRLGEKYKNVFC